MTLFESSRDGLRATGEVPPRMIKFERAGADPIPILRGAAA